MSRTAIQVTAAAFIVLGGCGRHTAVAVLRVRPPPLETGDSAGPQRLRVEEAVRDVATMGRLICEPPTTPSPELLGCWPANPGPSPAFVSLHLLTTEDGYEVGIMESFHGFSGPRLICSIQDRLTERLDFRLGGGVVERDPKVTCPRKAP